jgi:hypothetical protein
MKKYNTGEAIAMLAENPELRFRDDIGSVITTSKTTKKIVWEKNATQSEEDFIMYNRALNCDNLHIKWELIQQPIPFMEAVKAYSEGKTIRCELDGMRTQTYVWGTDSGFKNIRNNYGAVAAEEILNGKWYVEDSNE